MPSPPLCRHILLLNALFLLAIVPPIHPAPSYSQGQQQNQQQGSSSYSNYGQYLGGANGGGGGYRSNSAGGGNGMEYRVESEARRRLNNRHPPTAVDQRQQQKNLGSGMFREADHCQEKCEFDCQLQLFFSGRDNEPEELFYCAKLRPPPKAFHEKIVDGFNRAGIFEFIVGGVLAFSILICCICSCYQCCCKGGRTAYMGRRRGNASFDDGENGGGGSGPNGSGSGSGKGIGSGGAHSPLNGGGTLSTSGLSPEHESLTNSSKMDDGIHAAPLPDKQRFGGGGINNGGLIHHHNAHAAAHNHHAVPHPNAANNFLPRSNTGGAFSSRTHSDV